MKKLLVAALAILLALAITACVPSPVDMMSQDPQSESPVSQAEPSSETEVSDPDPGPNVITGTIYAVFNAESIREQDFGYEDYCTPDRVAEALSAWTGLNFDISYEIFQEDGIITVDWKSSSSLIAGPPDPQNEDFFFFDVDSLRWFMLNSLCMSIRENMDGDFDVFYSLDGGDMNALELSVDFNPAIAYNHIDDSQVVVK